MIRSATDDDVQVMGGTKSAIQRDIIALKNLDWDEQGTADPLVDAFMLRLHALRHGSGVVKRSSPG
jgi:hypothetical protein